MLNVNDDGKDLIYKEFPIGPIKISSTNIVNHLFLNYLFRSLLLKSENVLWKTLHADCQMTSLQKKRVALQFLLLKTKQLLT